MEKGNSNTSKQSALNIMLETCWEGFFPYLSNREIGKLDSALINFSLRKVFLSKVKDFYLVNKIYTRKELLWILSRNISLTKCHLEFEIKGKNPRFRNSNTSLL